MVTWRPWALVGKENMAKPTTVKEAIKKFEEAGGLNASEAEKVEHLRPVPHELRPKGI